MRRCIGRFLLVAFLAVVVGFYPLLAPTAHRIDHGHFDLVQDGMTRTDVEAIFGAPAGRYDWAEPDSVMRVRVWMSLAAQAQQVGDRQIGLGIRFLNALEAVNEGGVKETWVSRHGAFTVHFDASGRVTWKTDDGVHIVPPWQHWWQSLSSQW